MIFKHNFSAILIVSHRRSGTHQLIDALRNNLKDFSTEWVNLDQLVTGTPREATPEQLNEQIKQTPGITIIKSHFPPDGGHFNNSPSARDFAFKCFEEYPILCAYRDGRDVMVSLYKYMQAFNNSVKEMHFRDFLRSKNTFDIPANKNDDRSRPMFWRQHVDYWINCDNVFAVRYGKLRHYYHETVHEIADYLNLSPHNNIEQVEPHYPPRTYIERVNNRAKRILRLQKSSAVRTYKANTGYWTDFFSPEDEEYFWKQVGSMPWWQENR